MKRLVIALPLLPAAGSAQTTAVYRGPIIDVRRVLRAKSLRGSRY